MIEEMEKMALEAGFTAAKVIDTRALVFRPEYRAFCEENRCGQYERNYACPPASGTASEMADRATAWKHALVLNTRRAVKNAMDPEETRPIKEDHSRRSRALYRQLREAGLIDGGMMILAGPCGLCRPCRMTLDQPCPLPDERASCLSAYCVDVAALAGAAGMPLSWDMDQAGFFSMILFCRA